MAHTLWVGSAIQQIGVLCPDENFHVILVLLEVLRPTIQGLLDEGFDGGFNYAQSDRARES
eukprot:SAG11_NODE_4286_length_1968_cov_1.533440_4_plen_61_part_00